MEPIRTPSEPRLAKAPLGSLIAIVVKDSPATCADLERRIPELRRGLPALPFVLWVREATPRAVAQMAFRAQALHLRAVVIEGQPIRESLRSALTAPVDLGADVIEWLPLRGVRLQPDLADLVSQLFRDATAYKRLGTLLDASSHSERTARAQCRKAGLVPPSGWFQVARAIQAVLRLQHEPCSSVLSVALKLGYHDQSGLIHQIEHLFGLKPAAVRKLLGWECLLDRWVTHALPHADVAGRQVFLAACPAGFSTAD